jgi:hypothetical protein
MNYYNEVRGDHAPTLREQQLEAFFNSADEPWSPYPPRPNQLTADESQQQRQETEERIIREYQARMNQKIAASVGSNDRM